MNNSNVLVGRDPNARLDTGMKVSEAIEKTVKWWDDRGRALMLDHKIHQSKAGTVFASSDPEDPSFVPSGIINGRPWGELSSRERLRLVKFWHHFFVRMPEVIGTDEHEYQFGQRETVE